MKFKNSASLDGARTEIVAAAGKVRTYLWNIGVELLITRGTEPATDDRAHHNKSKHSLGEAFDFSLGDFPEQYEREQLRRNLQDYLGKDFDVQLHEHFMHVEYDPKSELQYKIKRNSRTAATIIETIGKLVTSIIPFYDSIRSLWKRLRG